VQNNRSWEAINVIAKASADIDTRIYLSCSLVQELTLESCLLQLVELKPLRVNERLAPGERDDAENDGEDDEEDGAFPLNGSKLSRGGYLHIIPRNSRMCLIRRYLSVHPADVTTNTTHRFSLAIHWRNPSLTEFTLANLYYRKPLDFRKKAQAAGGGYHPVLYRHLTWTNIVKV